MLNVWKFLAGGRAGTTINMAQYKADFADINKPHVLIDVRTPEEFERRHIPGAINIAVQVLPQRLNEVPKDKAVVLYCRSGSRSRYAAQLLKQAGYTEVYDLGGIGD